MPTSEEPHDGEAIFQMADYFAEEFDPSVVPFEIMCPPQEKAIQGPREFASPRQRRKEISKAKGYEKTMIRNKETNRKRQELECQTCHKTYTKLSNMKDHMKRHSGSRPYLCSLCGADFSQKGNRNKHESMNKCQDHIIVLPANDQQLGE